MGMAKTSGGGSEMESKENRCSAMQTCSRGAEILKQILSGGEDGEDHSGHSNLLFVVGAGFRKSFTRSPPRKRHHPSLGVYPWQTD